jgi:hypothetical protein
VPAGGGSAEYRSNFPVIDVRLASGRPANNKGREVVFVSSKETTSVSFVAMYLEMPIVC